MDHSERIKEIIEEENAEDYLVEEGDGLQDLRNRGSEVLKDVSMYEDAIIYYDKAIEIDPKYSPPWERKGMIYHKLGKLEEAIRCYDRVIEIESTKGDDWDLYMMWQRKGNIFDKLGKHEEAKECHDKVSKIKSTHSGS